MVLVVMRQAALHPKCIDPLNDAVLTDATIYDGLDTYQLRSAVTVVGGSVEMPRVLSALIAEAFRLGKEAR